MVAGGLVVAVAGIQYNFIAIDRFTKVARKIQKEAAKIDAIMNKGTKALTKQSASLEKTSTHVEKAAKKLGTLGTTTTEVAKKTSIGMKSIVKGLKSGGRSFEEITERVAKFGDSMAFKGYIQFTNIGLPIMRAGKMGLTYADQIEGAKVSMDAMFGSQKNYASVSKQINSQAAELSKHSRFTKQEIVATAGQIGLMTNNMKLARDLTPQVLKYAAIEQIEPAAAVSQVVGLIKSGGAFMGRVYPKGGSAAMAQKRYEMLGRQLSTPAMNKAYIEDSKAASAALHKMSGDLQKTAGVMLISATPALIQLGKALDKTMDKVTKFMKTHEKLTGDFVKGALMAMTFTTAITLLGAGVSAIAMPFEFLIKTVRILRTVYLAAAAASAVLGIANKATAASSVAAAGEETVAAKIVGGGGGAIGAAAAGLAVAGVGALVYGAHQLAQVKKAQYTTETQRLAYVRAHGYGGKTGKAGVLAYAIEKSEEGGGMGSGGLAMPGMAGSIATLTPVQHKIDMEIKLSQDGKVTSINATSPTAKVSTVHAPSSLGTNMVHAHG